MVTGADTVINAMAAGKLAAEMIESTFAASPWRGSTTFCGRRRLCLP